MLELIWSPAFKRGSLNSKASHHGAFVLSPLQVTEEQTSDTFYKDISYKLYFIFVF